MDPTWITWIRDVSDNASDREIARRIDIAPSTVGRWRDYPPKVDAAVNIADVYPDAVHTTVRELRAGMTVWSIWGDPYTLDKVTHFKHGCRIYRSDDQVEWFDYLDARGEHEQAFTVGLPA